MIPLDSIIQLFLFYGVLSDFCSSLRLLRRRLNVTASCLKKKQYTYCSLYRSAPDILLKTIDISVLLYRNSGYVSVPMLFQRCDQQLVIKDHSLFITLLQPITAATGMQKKEPSSSILLSLKTEHSVLAVQRILPRFLPKSKAVCDVFPVYVQEISSCDSCSRKYTSFCTSPYGRCVLLFSVV